MMTESRSKTCLNDSINTCKPNLVNVNTVVLEMWRYIYNGIMSKAVVTLDVIVVKMSDNSMVRVLQARVLTLP